MQRYFADIQALSEDVIHQAREQPDALRPVAGRIVHTMIPALVKEHGDKIAEDEESLAMYAYGAALGLCFASQEFQKGWTKDGLIDRRVHAAMALAQPPGGFLSAYFVQVGYWVGRTQDEGGRMLPGDW
jgi:hypothetical protein